MSSQGRRTAPWGTQRSKSSAGMEKGSFDELQAEGVHLLEEEAAPANEGAAGLPRVPAVPATLHPSPG